MPSSVLRWPFLSGLFLFAAGCGGFGIDARPGVADIPVQNLVARQEQGCEAVALDHMRGGHFTELAEIRLKGQLRVLWPQQDVTRDLMPDRLNVQVDRAGQILRMFCG